MALVDDPNQGRRLVSATLNVALDAENSENQQAGPFERFGACTRYRHGHCQRQPGTHFGNLTLAVPINGTGTFRSELLERDRRSERPLAGVLMEMALERGHNGKAPEATEVVENAAARCSRVLGGTNAREARA